MLTEIENYAERIAWLDAQAVDYSFCDVGIDELIRRYILACETLHIDVPVEFLEKYPIDPTFRKSRKI